MTESTFETIEFDYRDGVGVITLNRPERLNSFTLGMHAELRRAFDFLLSRDTLRGIVITGAGRGFCAGQDLSERPPLPPGETHDLSVNLKRVYEPLIASIRNAPVPVVAVVNGVAAGAGASLALACDVVIAAESARFIQAFSKIGLVPDAGSTYFLPRLIGTARAMGASLFGEAIGAKQAEQWGLIWECVPDDRLQDALDAIVTRLASAPTRAYGATKHLIHASAGHTLAQQLDLEATLQKEMGETHDYREGVDAFKEKRQPKFQGS